jgi:hypothetical protein
MALNGCWWIFEKQHQTKNRQQRRREVWREVWWAGCVGEARYHHFGGVGSWITGINYNQIVEFINYFFSAGLYYLVKPSHAALGQPLPQKLPGWGGWKCKKPCHWTGDQLHHGGVLCWMVRLLSTICLYYSYVENATALFCSLVCCEC